MFNLYRNERAVAAATFAGALAIATAVGTGGAAADPTWSITIEKYQCDFRRCLSHGGRQHSGKGYRRSKGLGYHHRSVETGDLFLEGGKRRQGVRQTRSGPDPLQDVRRGVQSITDSQHLVPAENGRYLFSVEANERRQHLRRDAKASGRSTEVAKRLSEEVDDAEADLKQINARLANADKLPVGEYNDLTKKADEDIKTINSTKALLGELKSVIETNSSNTLPALPKVSVNGTDGGAEKAISDFIARHKLCHPAGDGAKDVSSNDGKHAISCKIER